MGAAAKLHARSSQGHTSEVWAVAAMPAVRRARLCFGGTKRCLLKPHNQDNWGCNKRFFIGTVTRNVPVGRHTPGPLQKA